MVDAVAEYLTGHNANTHWEYLSSRETDALLLEARGRLAALLGCGADEVVFGANMTTLTWHLSRSIGRGLKAGDEIVVTELDHHANVAPWTALSRERGAVIRVVPMDPRTGTLDPGAVVGAIGPRTRLVAIGRASNALGTINDVRAVADAAHARGALVFVDAVHSAAHERTDVRAMGCDLLACSPYKFYGPHVGALYGRKTLLDELDVPRLEPASNEAPERLETGTLNHEGVVGAGEAVAFLASIGGGGGNEPTLGPALDRGFAILHERSEMLLGRMWDGLSSTPGVRLFGPPPDAPRTPTVAFTVAGVPSSRVAALLSDHHAVFVSHGDFYAKTVVDRLELRPEGLVRAGIACYTTAEEVDRLVAGVRAIP